MKGKMIMKIVYRTIVREIEGLFSALDSHEPIQYSTNKIPAPLRMKAIKGQMNKINSMISDF